MSWRLELLRWKICDRYDDKAEVFAYARVNDVEKTTPAGAI